MEKITFSFKNFNKDNEIVEHLKGFGYLCDQNILVPAIGRNGRAYIRVFEDITSVCHASKDSADTYIGAYEHHFVGSDGKSKVKTYSIWFKKVED